MGTHQADHVDQIDLVDVANPGNNLAYVETNMDVVALTKKNPYFERNFIGSYLAVCLGALSSYGGFVLLATSLALINADIGPSANITWVALVWTLSLSVGYTLVGRLSDIFGRRWFFIGCSLLATIGCVVGGTAMNVNSLIGANVLIGMAAAGQLSFSYSIGELVPIKHRGFVLAMAFTAASPFSALGSYIGRLFVVYTAAGWRWDYYVAIILNALSILLYLAFYHPPHFQDLHRNRSRMQELADLDYGGMILFVAGLVLFLMGLSWGGSLYPWDSAHVIATIVVGFVVCVCFVLYECYMPLRRPLIPMHLFRNRDYVVLVIVTCVGGMLYYSQNAFTGALAGVTTDQNGASALATLSAIMIGAMESMAITLVTIVISDQSELGTGVGAFGSLRAMSGVVATTIFSAILTNKVTGYTDTIVVPDLLKAGLPASSVVLFLTALEAGDSSTLASVPGVNKTIISVGAAALKLSYSKAFIIVYLVSIACGVLSVIAAWFTPNLEDRIHSHAVVRRLGGTNVVNGSTNQATEDAEV
ncbi:siderophore iron transporter [Exophiala viscosa]|uniref:Siderophore iron transporter n=1 Tax=Exophiala viscosa TaxID=2486360 RepID=A0AAN6IFU0_9EURO|nr:siderophore iron transporter [Exophiala viscosa]